MQDVYGMLKAGGNLKNTEDDQLFYTKLFLDPEVKNKYDIKLDNRAEIFQNLNGNEQEIELEFEGEKIFYSLKCKKVCIVISKKYV